MGTFLSDIVLQVLSFVAENERSNIRQRQAEGIAAAKARGVKFGRPPKPLPENFHTVYQRWKNGKITGTKAAEECNMPITTFRYKADIYEKTNFLRKGISAIKCTFLQIFSRFLHTSILTYTFVFYNKIPHN